MNDVEVVDIDSAQDENILMLNTIRMPKNLKHLTERLPKSNYGSA